MTRNKDLPYVFWLYGWNHTGRFLSTEDLIRCDVTSDNIHIESQPIKDIPTHLIQECIAYATGGSAFMRHMIRLKVKTDDKPEDVFIFPANPIEPDNERGNGSEVNAFSELINGIVSRRGVTINPNPYCRTTVPKQWAVEELDAYTSPWVYYHRYRKKPSLKQAVVQMVVTVVVLAVLVVLLALFAEYLTH